MSNYEELKMTDIKRQMGDKEVEYKQFANKTV